MLFWLLIMVFAVVLIALCIYFSINEAYKKNNGYITVWSADVALTYFGTIIGALVTVVALIVTIYFTNKTNREEREYQNQKVILDIKKERLLQKQEDYLEVVSNIKQIILLENKEESIFEKIFVNASANSLAQKFIDAMKVCEYQYSRNEMTDRSREFWKENQLILTDYMKLLSDYYKSEEEYNKQRKELSEKEGKIKPVIELSKKYKQLQQRKNELQKAKRDKTQIESLIAAKSSIEIAQLESQVNLEMSLNKVTKRDLEKFIDYVSPKIPSESEVYHTFYEKLIRKLKNIEDPYIEKYRLYIEFENENINSKIMNLYK